MPIGSHHHIPWWHCIPLYLMNSSVLPQHVKQCDTCIFYCILRNRWWSICLKEQILNLHVPNQIFGMSRLELIMLPGMRPYWTSENATSAVFCFGFHRDSNLTMFSVWSLTFMHSISFNEPSWDKKVDVFKWDVDATLFKITFSTSFNHWKDLSQDMLRGLFFMSVRTFSSIACSISG